MSVLDQVKQLLGIGGDGPGEVTFKRRQVSPIADFQVGFVGTYVYVDDGVEHEIERRFDVYVEGDRVDELPVAEITETHREDGEVVDEDSEEVACDVDTELTDSRLHTALHTFLESWHDRNDPRPAEVQAEAED